MLGIRRYMIHSSCTKGALGFVEEADVETNYNSECCSGNTEFILLTWPWAGVRDRMRKLLSRAPKMCIRIM